MGERDMDVHTQIGGYLAAQPDLKRGDMRNINLPVLEAAIRDGSARTGA